MSNTEFVVSPYDPATHKPALLEFLSTVYDRDTLARRESVMDWVHLHHPHRERQPLRYVIMDGAKVAATMGHLPCDFLVDGQVVAARYTHDLLVDPTYRGKGLAKRIVSNAPAQGEFLPGGMWMTGPCYKIHLACGFDDAPPLPVRTLVLDTDQFVGRKYGSGIKGRLAGVALSLLRRRALARAENTPGIVCRDIGEFDPAHDDAWMALLKTYRITMLRDAAHLNWKYMRHPVLQYSACIAERGGEPAGFMIWRQPWHNDEEKRAVITDFVVARGDVVAFESLLAHVIREVRDSAAVVSALSSQPWAAKVLRGFGFLPRQDSHAWVVGNWKDLIFTRDFADTGSWHMCMGDSDGDLWTGSA